MRYRGPSAVTQVPLSSSQSRSWRDFLGLIYLEPIHSQVFHQILHLAKQDGECLGFREKVNWLDIQELGFSWLPPISHLGLIYRV